MASTILYNTNSIYVKHYTIPYGYPPILAHIATMLHTTPVHIPPFDYTILYDMIVYYIILVGGIQTFICQAFDIKNNYVIRPLLDDDRNANIFDI